MNDDEINKLIDTINKTLKKSGIDKQCGSIEIGKDVSEEQWRHFVSNKWIHGK